MVALLSALVPRAERAEWREEWESELEALADGSARPDGNRYPVWAASSPEWYHTSFGSTRGNGPWTVCGRTFVTPPAASPVLQPPPGIREPERVIQIARSCDAAPRWDSWSDPALRLIGEESPVFSAVGGYQTEGFVLGRGEETESVAGPAAVCPMSDERGRFDVVRGSRPQTPVGDGQEVVVGQRHQVGKGSLIAVAPPGEKDGDGTGIGGDAGWTSVIGRRALPVER